ncbi:Sister chromatid cohesion protein 2 [Ascosphaera acerosa]|nr:Sister chromatid cohesion protein 2 [Ascosphaera acerosa]
MVPRLPPTHHTSQYTSIPESHAHELVPEQQPAAGGITTRDARTLAELRQVADRREKADAAQAALRELLDEVFEADDELAVDALGQPGTAASDDVFLPASRILAPTTHHKLHRALGRVAKYKRMGHMPRGDLRRLQKLCELSILDPLAEDVSVEALVTEAEADAEASASKLEGVLTWLMAANTFLCTTSGGDDVPHDLCPEDVIQQIPRILAATLDNCIIPVVEARPDERTSALWAWAGAAPTATTLAQLCHQAKNLLVSLASFLTTVDVAENIVTATEFLAAKLIFVENAASERDSVLGCQRFEPVRRAAMDLLARIFARYADQRGVILDEILASLEKLPSTRQNARQFKLADGKSIQLVSALVMQLVQTTTLLGDGRKVAIDAAARRAAAPRNGRSNNRGSRRPKARRRQESDSDDELNESPAHGAETSESSSEGEDGDGDTPLETLISTVDPLYGNAVHSARYITKYIVQRAMTSTKTGDQPYRNLLDLFTEDLLGVVGSADWPSAELLLRVLASQMISIAEHEKSLANAKNMALELLGWMGSSIAQLTSAAHHLAATTQDDDGDVEVDSYLRGLLEKHSMRSVQASHLVAADGPYEIVLSHLQERDSGSSWHLASAKGYVLAQWAKSLTQVYYDPDRGDTSNAAVEKLCRRLEAMLRSPRDFQAEIEKDVGRLTGVR